MSRWLIPSPSPTSFPRIKEGGYDIFLVLEATIGVSKPGEKSSEKPALMTTEFKISDQDLKFLKSLRIKVEDDAA